MNPFGVYEPYSYAVNLSNALYEHAHLPTVAYCIVYSHIYANLITVIFCAKTSLNCYLYTKCRKCYFFHEYKVCSSKRTRATSCKLHSASCAPIASYLEKCKQFVYLNNNCPGIGSGTCTLLLVHQQLNRVIFI